VGKNRSTDHRLHRNDHDAEAGEIVGISDYALPTGSYPLLSAVLKAKGLSLKGTYTYEDALQILGGSKRSLQERARRGELTIRDLPARGRFLSTDLELFLRNSARKPKPQGDER